MFGLSQDRNVRNEVGLLLCWVPYAALGVLWAQCGHCGEKLLVIKGKGHLTATWNQDHAQYAFQLVYKYMGKKIALVLSHHHLSAHPCALSSLARAGKGWCCDPQQLPFPLPCFPSPLTVRASVQCWADLLTLVVMPVPVLAPGAML